MDVVYMNELLEKRRNHGMDYFGKDKKLKSSKFFFFLENNLVTKQTLENTEKCSLNFFFSKMQPNTIKYFSEIIFHF